MRFPNRLPETHVRPNLFSLAAYELDAGVVEVIARGAFGEVYRAFDPTLQIQVALKLFPPGRSPRGRTSLERAL